jgi:hypothetical protein
LEDNNRGNPGAAAKLRYFAASMPSIAGKVDIAMFKLCWIDSPFERTGPAAFFNSVRATMESLEKAYPKVKFVWWTMPITTSSYYEASSVRAQRQLYNAAVRAYCEAGKKWLLDLAALESHEDSGKPLVDASGNELLYPGYSTDGGHLNPAGRLKVAKAYWRLLAEVAR